jgi:hypothetical protein
MSLKVIKCFLYKCFYIYIISFQILQLHESLACTIYSASFHGWIELHFSVFVKYELEHRENDVEVRYKAFSKFVVLLHNLLTEPKCFDDNFIVECSQVVFHRVDKRSYSFEQAFHR